jgi:hypothetical protein
MLAARAHAIDDAYLDARVRAMLNRWPSVGLAVGVVSNHGIEFMPPGPRVIAQERR